MSEDTIAKGEKEKTLPSAARGGRVDIHRHANDPVNVALSGAEKVSMYRDMVRIRRFEERAVRAYQQGKIGGFLHLYIGQESIAVGSVSILGETDHIITAYRDHGHALAIGMTMKECMAELYGKYTGCSKGKGGSMHYFDPAKRFWGGHGIVGGQTPLGAGVAYALKYKGIEGSCLCFLGDGAVNQGAFHESLNLVSLWDLPVVYIIENNGYSMGTSQNRSSVYPEYLARRAEAYKIDWDVCHGHLVYEVRARIAKCMRRAREESRPTVLELLTYRYRGHSIADANAEKYRTKEEIRDYQENRDPINVFQTLLRKEGHLTDDHVKAIDREAREEANEAAAFADESPFPPTEELLRDVYWTADNPGGHTNEGRTFFNDDFPANA